MKYYCRYYKEIVGSIIIEANNKEEARDLVEQGYGEYLKDTECIGLEIYSVDEIQNRKAVRIK